MRLTPKTEDEIGRGLLLEPGEYDFTVLAAEDKQSRAGNDMLVATLEVFTGDGGKRQVTDYIVEAMEYKCRHFAFAIGLGASYEAGLVTAEEVVGRSGRVRLAIESQEGFRPKNVVKDYIVPDASKAASTAAKSALAAGFPAATAAATDEPPF